MPKDKTENTPDDAAKTGEQQISAPGADKLADNANKTARTPAAGLRFTNPETANKYEALVTVDRTVHNAKLYSGLLSKIPPAMAEAMVTQKSNLIKTKD